jgi:cytochrome oxidase Cu insertion factor (SCO1/SenC/PrrC family)
MRALLVLIALAILVAIGLVYTGVISLSQTRQAQTPAFDLKVKRVEVGTTTSNVTMPTVGTTTKQVETPTVRLSDGNSQ